MTARTATATKVSRLERNRGKRSPAPPVHPPDDLGKFIGAEQWAVFRSALVAARDTDVPLGGGLAISFYTGLWRPTKDIDLYVTPEDKDAIVEGTRSAGLEDYFPKVPYDRNWIYRATSEDGSIVDTIWALANSFAQVDRAWLVNGPVVSLFDQRVRLVAAEELIWSKIHVVQRERCDWPDLVNLLFASGPHLDWERLMGRLAGEERLLASLLLLFSWIAPGRAAAFPEWIWAQLEIAPPEPGPIKDEERIRNLDSRPWFMG